jgi:V/A-type H+-transporting ATPase subunit A
MALRAWALALLQRDRELRDVAGLVGPDALEDQDRLVLEVARWVRELLISQSAYEAADASSPPPKTWLLASLLREASEAAAAAIAAGASAGSLDLAAVRRAIAATRAAAASGLEQAAAKAREEIAHLAATAGRAG